MDTIFNHPDYEPETMLINELIEQPYAVASLVEMLKIELANEMEFHGCNDTLKQWLGTFIVNGHEAQLQLILTTESVERIDED